MGKGAPLQPTRTAAEIERAPASQRTKPIGPTFHDTGHGTEDVIENHRPEVLNK